MFFKKKVKKSLGMELIDEVASRFIAVIDELDKGVAGCREEQSDIEYQIKVLHQRNRDLDESVLRASGICSNLRSLLGQK